MQRTVNINDWIRNLNELGCSNEMTIEIANFVKTNNMDDAAKLLRQHKRLLLDELHKSENKVDLLDFLLYQLKKAKN